MAGFVSCDLFEWVLICGLVMPINTGLEFFDTLFTVLVSCVLDSFGLIWRLGVFAGFRSVVGFVCLRC